MYLAGYRNLFLLPVFAVRDGTFVLVESEEKDRIFQPMRLFWPPSRRSLLYLPGDPVLLRQHRFHSPQPGSISGPATEGTQRIVKYDFSSMVKVKSGDESRRSARCLQQYVRTSATGSSGLLPRTPVSTLRCPISSRYLYDCPDCMVGGLEAFDADIAGIALRTGESPDEMMLRFFGKWIS